MLAESPCPGCVGIAAAGVVLSEQLQMGTGSQRAAGSWWFVWVNRSY